jgi:hypothetical protein
MRGTACEVYNAAACKRKQFFLKLFFALRSLISFNYQAFGYTLAVGTRGFVNNHGKGKIGRLA